MASAVGHRMTSVHDVNHTQSSGSHGCMEHASLPERAYMQIVCLHTRTDEAEKPEPIRSRGSMFGHLRPNSSDHQQQHEYRAQPASANAECTEGAAETKVTTLVQNFRHKALFFERA